MGVVESTLSGRRQEAEGRVIGKLLVDDVSSREATFSAIPSQFFSDEVYRVIYSAIQGLHVDGIAKMDFHLVLARSVRADCFEEVAYRSAIRQAMTLALDYSDVIDGSVEALNELAIRSELYKIGKRITDLVARGDVSNPLDQAIVMLSDLDDKRSGHVQATSIGEDVPTVMEHLLKGSSAKMKTGFRSIDKEMGGLDKSSWTVIAARPGEGKSSLLLNIANRHAITGGTPMVVSLEMTKEAITTRHISAISQTPMMHLQSGRLNETQLMVITSEVKPLERVLSVSPGNINVNQFAAIARDAVRKQGATMVMLDYLGLLAPTRKNQNTLEHMRDATRMLAMLALELGVPLLTACQLNREYDKAGSKNNQGAKRRPRMSDLRDSGTIEQDADNVVFLYPSAGEIGSVRRMFFDVQKHRNGPCGYHQISFEPAKFYFPDQES